MKHFPIIFLRLFVSKIIADSIALICIPDYMKTDFQAVHLSSIVPWAVQGEFIRIRATASANSIPIAGFTRFKLNLITYRCCLYRGGQCIRLDTTNVHPRAASQRAHPLTRAQRRTRR